MRRGHGAPLTRKEPGEAMKSMRSSKDTKPSEQAAMQPMTALRARLTNDLPVENGTATGVTGGWAAWFAFRAQTTKTLDTATKTVEDDNRMQSFDVQQ
jgi:hypothetical protein